MSTAPSTRDPGAPPPVYGWTVGLHLVELDGRTAAQNRRDPVKLVAGIGWPKWLPVEALRQWGAHRAANPCPRSGDRP